MTEPRRRRRRARDLPPTWRRPTRRSPRRGRCWRRARRRRCRGCRGGRAGWRQRIMDRVTGRKSDRHATTLVIQRASPSPNDDTRASFEPKPEPARDLSSSLLFAGGTTRERRASNAARASARCAGRRRRGPASRRWRRRSPGWRRTRGTRREGTRPAPAIATRRGRRAETRGIGRRVRAEPRERETEENPAEHPPHGNAPVIARLHDGRRASPPRRGRRWVRRPASRLRFRGDSRSATGGMPLLRRLDFRAGQRHLRDALSGVRGDAGVHPVIRRGVHLRRRRENLLRRRRVRRHGVVKVRPTARCQPAVKPRQSPCERAHLRSARLSQFFGSTSTSTRGGRRHEPAGNDAGE